MRVKDLLGVYKKGYFCIYEPVYESNGDYVDERYLADHNTSSDIMDNINDREVDFFDVVESDLIILLKPITSGVSV